MGTESSRVSLRYSGTAEGFDEIFGHSRHDVVMLSRRSPMPRYSTQIVDAELSSQCSNTAVARKYRCENGLNTRKEQNHGSNQRTKIFAKMGRRRIVLCSNVGISRIKPNCTALRNWRVSPPHRIDPTFTTVVVRVSYARMISTTVDC